MNTPANKTIRNTGCAITVALLFSACATTATPTATPEAPAQQPPSYTQAADFYYTVERGDMLTAIALRFTGSEENWSAIAEANGVTNPRKLRIGQQLVVPGYLLPPVANKTPTTRIPTSVAVQSLDQTTAQAEPSVIDDVGPDAAQVELNKANPNKRFVLRPLGTDISNEGAELTENEYIRIVGSYFPKVVYKSPQLNAKLLMRVTPGTTFPLEKLDDGWYQISTDQGPGYLRLEDGKPTDNQG